MFAKTIIERVISGEMLLQRLMCVERSFLLSNSPNNSVTLEKRIVLQNYFCNIKWRYHLLFFDSHCTIYLLSEWFWANKLYTKADNRVT